MRPQDATRPYPPPTERALGRQQSPPPQQRAGAHPNVRAADDAKPQKSVAITRASFLGSGLLVLTSVTALPIWDALLMLGNFDYVMWGERAWPIVILGVSGGLLVLFMLLILLTTTCSGYWAREANTSQSLLQTASMFLTLFGIMMVLVSFPLSLNALSTWNDLTYDCLSHEHAREIHDEYETLLRLRTGSTCQPEYTIEACEGFQASPVTDYLKNVESKFRCAGFCHDFSGAGLAQTSAAVSEAAPAARANLLRRRRGGEVAALQQDASYDGVAAAQPPASATDRQLPALFSSGTYTNTCEKMVARHMTVLSESIAWQLWASGFVLIIVSLLVVLWDWSTTMPK